MNGLVFDMDGVLLDSHPAHLKAWRCVLNDAGRAVSDVELEYVLDGHKRSEILRHFLGEMDCPKAAYYSQLKDEYFARFSDSVTPLPGLLSLLSDIRTHRLPMAVATSACQHRADFLLGSFGLHGYFSAIATGDDVLKGKPDPAIYELAATRLAISPEHLVVVEDAVSGVKAARAAGMRCIGVAKNGRAAALLRAGAQLVVPDFCGLTVANLTQIFGSGTPTPSSN